MPLFPVKLPEEWSQPLDEWILQEGFPVRFGDEETVQTNAKRVYKTEDLAPGKKIIFACTGVTDGNLLRGVRFFGEGIRTQSLIVTLEERQVRFVDTVTLDKRPDVKVRFS